jgi:hypothetical protein
MACRSLNLQYTLVRTTFDAVLAILIVCNPASRYAVPDDEFESWDLKKSLSDDEVNDGMLVDEPERDVTVKMEGVAHIEISSDESDGKPGWCQKMCICVRGC